MYCTGVVVIISSLNSIIRLVFEPFVSGLNITWVDVID